tara:strand:+ start:5464 stop:6048 length:585 start_codon:yes stop_codon:yes gene_type:complete
MFTGIIETTGIVKSIKENKKNLDIIVSSSLSSELNVDESLSHNGVCLTITNCNNKSHSVTVVNESLDKSNFSKINIGSIINLERSMKIGGRIDGHLVQGHVDDTAKCIEIIDQGNSWSYVFEYSNRFSNYIIEKGSICINGVSLTCFDVKSNIFSVAIIPHTYNKTNFKFLNMGDIVNLEFDMVGKYINKIAKL